MGKKALCMRRERLFWLVAHPEAEGLQQVNPSAIFYTRSDALGLTMEDRDTCESDESLLQLIPYIALMNAHGEFYCYTRGNASGEERLKAKLSLGLGGHVDTFPASGQSLADLLCREGERELREEVGLDIRLRAPTRAIIRSQTPVDRVHLGIFFTVSIASDWEPVEETGHISSVGFLSRESLRKQSVFERLEGWSQIVVDQF